MDAYYMTAEGQVFRPLAGESTQGYTPVAVIDFEDREQVERLRVALVDVSFAAWGCGAESALQAALREYANPTPPKPDEPLGLGAVVEDAEGQLWTRVGFGCWVARGQGLTGYGWGEIDVADVLHKGWSA